MRAPAADTAGLASVLHCHILLLGLARKLPDHHLSQALCRLYRWLIVVASVLDKDSLEHVAVEDALQPESLVQVLAVRATEVRPSS
jgi:hypothetical protein